MTQEEKAITMHNEYKEYREQLIEIESTIHGRLHMAYLSVWVTVIFACILIDASFFSAVLSANVIIMLISLLNDEVSIFSFNEQINLIDSDIYNKIARANNLVQDEKDSIMAKIHSKNNGIANKFIKIVNKIVLFATLANSILFITMLIMYSKNI